MIHKALSEAICPSMSSHEIGDGSHAASGRHGLLPSPWRMSALCWAQNKFHYSLDSVSVVKQPDQKFLAGAVRF